MATSKKLLEIDDLHVEFMGEEGPIRAVRGVHLHLDEGECLGLVGESGCGKTVTALAVLQLLPRPKSRIARGHIRLWRDEQVTDLVGLGFDSAAMRNIRGKDIAMVFQEPMTSLNPSFPIGFQISEALLLHQGLSKREARGKSIESLSLVGIPDPESMVDRYPHELSGGMRQRAMIAMALACRPRLLIADEPTTALDVTVQAQILDLMKQNRNRFGMSILWITHDLEVVGELCDKVAVMYLGQVVEYSTVEAIFARPLHPYTRGLLGCLPRIGGGEAGELVPIPGNVPSPLDMPAGCAFAPRCDRAHTRCCDPPALVEVDGVLVRCWLYGEGRSS